MAEQKIDSWLEYKDNLVKAINTRDNTAFYGVLKEIDDKDITLFPYLRSRCQQNGQWYWSWAKEGKPIKITRDSISAIHETDKDEIDLIISSDKRIVNLNAMKSRLEEISTEMNLKEVEKVYQKSWKHTKRKDRAKKLACTPSHKFLLLLSGIS